MSGLDVRFFLALLVFVIRSVVLLGSKTWSFHPPSLPPTSPPLVSAATRAGPPASPATPLRASSPAATSSWSDVHRGGWLVGSGTGERGTSFRKGKLER